MKVKSESEVTQSCPTLSDPMDCSLPGSSVHGIFQARVLEWGAIAFSCVFLEDNMTLATTDSPTSMEEAYFPQDYISNVFFYFSHCNKLISLRHLLKYIQFFKYFHFSCFYLNSEDDQKVTYARPVINLFSMCFLCQSGLFQLQVK